jgi:hypothetical protein
MEYPYIQRSWIVSYKFAVTNYRAPDTETGPTIRTADLRVSIDKKITEEVCRRALAISLTCTLSYLMSRLCSADVRRSLSQRSRNRLRQRWDFVVWDVCEFVRIFLS